MSTGRGRLAASTRRWAIGLAVAIHLLGAGGAPLAGADWINGDQYFYSRSGVPDLDQRRSALPAKSGGVGGDTYCVPVATMNWLAYMGSHGWKEIAPGDADWSSGHPLAAANYAYMNGALLNLGSVMGTNPQTGTTVDDAYIGLQTWLGFYAQGQYFVPMAYSFYETYMPPFDEIAHIAIDHGWGFIPTLGWYTQPVPADNEWGAPAGARVRRGGHQVTMVAAARFGGDPLMTLNDPWTTPDDDLETQSPYQPLTTSIVETTGTFGYVTAGGGFYSNTRTFGHLAVYSTGNGYLDGFLAIAPKIGFTLEGIKIKVFKILAPKASAKRPTVETRTFRTAGGRVLDLALNPVSTRQPYLIEGSDAVWLLDTITGRSTRLLSLPGPRRLGIDGGRQRLYVLLRDELVLADVGGRVLARTSLGGRLDAIAVDERRGVVVGVSSAEGAVIEFDGADLALVRRRVLPPLPAGGADADRLSMSIDPRDGAVWLLRDGAADVARLGLESAGDLTVTPLALPGRSHRTEALHVDERGLLFVTVNGKIHAFDPTGERRREHAFDGETGGTVLHILRPSTNVEPGTLRGPAWENVPPGPSR